MSRIRGKHTAPELIVRSLLHRLGYRFRLHKRIPIPEPRARPRSRPRPRFVGPAPPSENQPRFATANRSLPGNHLRQVWETHSKFKIQKSLTVRPDIVLPKYKTAIFVHGCFWHRHRGCKNCTTPTHRREFWVKKLEGNAARDKRHQQALRKLGWRVIVIWECEIYGKGLKNCLRKIFSRHTTHQDEGSLDVPYGT